MTDALRKGARLHAEGAYFEAHEAWEELWLSLDGEPRLFVQGLIQVTAACHKAFVQGQPNGCVKLLQTALDKLEGSPHDFLGIRTEPLLRGARAMLAEAQRWRDAERPPLTRELVPPIDVA